MARKHYVGCKHNVIADGTMVPYMVPTPKDNIISNSCKRLDCIIFQNEAIVSNFIAKCCGLTTNIADELKTLGSCDVKNPCPHAVHLRRRHWCEKTILCWRI